MNIDWKSKLTSRKFWAALVAVIVAVLAFFNVSDMEVEQVVTLVSAFGVLVAYILGEGMVDAARIKGSSTTEYTLNINTADEEEDDANAET